MKAIKEFIRLNKKMFFTFCGIIGSFLLILIILLIVKLVKGTKITYAELETKIIAAAKEYYSDNTKTLPKIEGEEISISLDKLVTDGYIKPLEKLVDATCTGTVTVKKNGKQYMYYPNLDCGSEYKTRFLSKIITDESNIVTEGAGIYKYEDGYVFRGEYVNNYITLDNNLWRIVSIDNDGNLKLVKNEPLENQYAWDDRYNVTVDGSFGINDYAKSRIQESLQKLYEHDELIKNSKEHLITYPLCIGKRNSDDMSINKQTDCGTTYSTNVGILSLYEIENGSIDSNCNSINTEACKNYNYFSNFMYGTWISNTANDNTYQAYFGGTYGVDLIDSSEYSDVYPVIVLSGKELYSSGNGSEDNPYLIPLDGK